MLRRWVVARNVVTGDVQHERDMKLLQSLIHPGDKTIDIGANVGLYTKLMSILVQASGHVFAIEPISNNYAILIDVIRKANLSNVSTFPVALSAADGTGTMVVPKGESFTGYYLAHLTDDTAEAGEYYQVTKTTLDALIPEHDAIAFIKCDVEGAELDVFQGGKTLLTSSKPIILVEVSKGTSDAVFHMLLSLGFQGYVYRAGLGPTETFLDGEFSNYFFVHPAQIFSILNDGIFERENITKIISEI